MKPRKMKSSETVKWGNGCWLGKEYPVIFLHSEPDHLQFGFFAGAEMKDPRKILQGSGQYVRHVKVRTVGDIDAREFSRMIREAAKLERTG